MHVKGLELPAYDVRGAKGHGLGYATSYTGADHNKGYAIQEIFGLPFPYPVDRLRGEGQGRADDVEPGRAHRQSATAPPCASSCSTPRSLPSSSRTRPASWSAPPASTSRPDDVQRVGERVNNLARAFNTLAGLTRADDDLPERLKTEPIPQGPAKGQLISQADLDLMLDEYYEARGWTPDGVPTRAKLEELRLGYAADRLGLGDNGPRADHRPAEVADQAGGVRRRTCREGASVADLLARLAATYGGAVAAHLTAPATRTPIRRCASWSTAATSACWTTGARPRRGRRRARTHADRRRLSPRPRRSTKGHHENARLREPLHHPGMGRRSPRERRVSAPDARRGRRQVAALLPGRRLRALRRDRQAARPRRRPDRGDGRGRRRPGGPLADGARLRTAQLRTSDAGWRASRTTRWRPRCGASRPLPGVRGPVPEGRGRRRARAGARGPRARPQGLEDPLELRRLVPRREALLADPRQGGGARRPRLPASGRADDQGAAHLRPRACRGRRSASASRRPRRWCA